MTLLLNFMVPCCDSPIKLFVTTPHSIFLPTDICETTESIESYGSCSRAACSLTCCREVFPVLCHTQNCNFTFHPVYGLELYCKMWNMLPLKPKEVDPAQCFFICGKCRKCKIFVFSFNENIPTHSWQLNH